MEFVKGIFNLIIIIAVFWFLGRWFFGLGKYEGENAEYWFNAYDEASSDVDYYYQQVKNYEDRYESEDKYDEDILEVAECLQDSRSFLRQTVRSLCDAEKQNNNTTNCPGTIAIYLDGYESSRNNSISKCLEPIL